jgi:hypothetical protein
VTNVANAQGHPGVGSLSRGLTRAIEALATCLPTAKLAYVAAGLPPAAARMAGWLLPELVGGINAPGAERIVRSLAVLQPAVSGLVPEPLALADGVIAFLPGLGEALVGAGAAGTSGMDPVAIAAAREADMRKAHTHFFDRTRSYYQVRGKG